MLPDNTIEENLSISCVSAIIARAGYSPSQPSYDFGIDLEVRKIASTSTGKKVDVGAILSLQLKASINWKIENEFVIYDLEADAYNRIIFQNNNAMIPVILILCCLEKNKTEWLTVSEDEFTIKKCCYFYRIKGEETKNTSSVRIKIPRDQIFTPNAILELID